MPRYFFSCEGAASFNDEEGVELPDLQAARVQAICNASEIMGDDPQAFATRARWRGKVADADGRTVFTVTVEGVPPVQDDTP